ncbi:preprotein translocase subunit YajC [Nannocystis bainbridge]|uniref:Sec translocon accessory complex subunit YajC n=1 Tax=Nannocystis bainbridge TaxID=2995303 RepID=A0ABT5E1N4_9BACT|nr:preprotein translocase subunit YajC [Nannocystis bainbridge]MDC0719785.1 preprotein translocase subunit YajC [Nannocystis bainbridge]
MDTPVRTIAMLATILAQAPAASNPLSGFIVPILMFAAIYFILIRPMGKQEKDRKARLDKLAAGDTVRLTGGIIGRISSIDGPIAMVEVAERVKLKVVRAEIADRFDPDAATKPEAAAAATK